mgnify:CR=1 FL=1
MRVVMLWVLHIISLASTFGFWWFILTWGLETPLAFILTRVFPDTKVLEYLKPLCAGLTLLFLVFYGHFASPYQVFLNR